jgi:hypothetical protein
VQPQVGTFPDCSACTDFEPALTRLHTFLEGPEVSGMYLICLAFLLIAISIVPSSRGWARGLSG